MKCKEKSCGVTSPSKLNADGYCGKHKDRTIRSKRSSSSSSPIISRTADDENETLADRISVLETENAEMRAENREIRAASKAALEAIDGIHSHMNIQRESINTSTYKRDALNQYGRRESKHIINKEEEPVQLQNGKIVETEDCVQLAIDAAEVLDIKLEKSDIQRAHRVGKRKLPFVGTDGKTHTPKPRPIIVKLKDYGKRMSIIKNKRKFQKAVEKKGASNFKNAFIVEDLTPL